MQGDVVGIVNDATGEQVVDYSYDAWGNITSITGIAASTIGQYNSMRYRGYYYDTDTGMYYLQSRYYNPQMRRFINADEPDIIQKLSKVGVFGVNIFLYCNNSPINHNDNNGRIAISTCILIGSIIVGIIAATCTAIKTYKNSGKIDWIATFVNGISWGMLAYSCGMTAYGIYTEYCYSTGKTPVTEVTFNNSQSTIQKSANAVKSSTTGHVSGTKQHTEFARKIKKSGNKSLKTEVSYKNGKVVKHGTKGSIRVDVAQYDKNGKLTCVYDLKTGSAKLTSNRIMQIQKHVGKVPVIEVKPK